MFKIVNNIKTHGFLLVAVAILGAIGLSSINSDAAFAANTKNRMLGIAGVCSNLKDNNEGTNHKFLCEPVEKKLKDNAGCEAVTYAITLNTDPTDESVTEKRWFIKPTAYKACHDKIEAMLKRFETGGNCVLGAKGSDKHKNCKDRDDDLSEVLGCSNDLVYDSGDRFRAKPDAVSKCRERLNAVGNLKLTIGNPDGTTRVSTVAVKDIGTDADTEGLGNNAASDEEESSAAVNCQGGPMGWLFCPMINYMTSTLQTLARLIDDLMQVKFLAQDGSAKSIESAWRAFLSIANIMLVIAFMVIVFSQSTGAGLNNYNIKRMLPRLVIAAVLMNVSFYICALAIDISNIVGASIMGLFIGGGSVGDAITNATGGPGGKGILGGALTGALLIGLLLFILTPVILSIIIVFVCLVARQLILICLILASPIAFVAWLLPNTEQYFKKWYSLFFQMLILYPAVMFIFGASLYFAKFLGAGGQGIEIGTAEDGSNLNEILTQIIQLIVLCIPLVALPLLIKGSSNIMGKIGGYANQAGLGGVKGAKGAGKMAGKGFKKTPGIREGFESVEQFKGARSAAGQRKKAGRAVRRAGIMSRTPGATGDILGARAVAERDKLFNEEVGMYEAQMLDDSPAAVGKKLQEAIASGNHHEVRAGMNRLANMGVGGANELSDAIHAAGPINNDMATTIQRGLNDSSNYGALVGKAADLTKGGFEGGAGEAQTWKSGDVTDVSAQQLAGQSGDAMMRSAGITISKDGNGKETFSLGGAPITEADAIKAAAQHLQKGASAKVSAIDGNSDLEALVADDKAGAILSQAKSSVRGPSAPAPAAPAQPAPNNNQGGSQIRGGSGTSTGGSVSWTPKN